MAGRWQIVAAHVSFLETLLRQRAT
ncbi:MAG: hypothetical protein ACP5M5_10230 [Acidibrevibacterium sp.]